MTEPVGHGPRASIPANSHISKEVAVPKSESREKAEKAIQGSATIMKQPWYKRLGRSMIADDSSTIGEYIMFDIVVPAAKNLLREIVVGGMDRTLFGSSVRTGGSGGRGTPGGIRQKYNEMTRAQGGYVDPRRQMSQQDRATHNFETILLDTRQDAIEVLNRMIDRIEKYGSASVADLYDYCNITTGDYAAQRWGWTTLLGADVRQYRSHWHLDLPDPTVLRN